jgi:phosphatidylserine decarboxylase
MKSVSYRVGKWLPSDRVVLNKWIASKLEAVKKKESDLKEKNEKIELRPSVKALRDAIYADPVLFMNFTSMYDEIPQVYEEPVKNFETMLKLIDHIIDEAPAFSVIENEIGLIGFPINAILDWAMGTQGGYMAFTHPVVNEKLKVILNEWSQFLEGEKSTSVLVDGKIDDYEETDYSNPVGWFTPEALLAIAKVDPKYKGGDDIEKARESFIRNYQCDISAEHWGYKSWDHFFTRNFNKGIREVSLEDQKDPNVIVNACESAPFKCVTNAKMKDKFWMKGQPYSLSDIMDNCKETQEFKEKQINNETIGSTVYQAFLCSKSYHKWHSPVDGTVKAIYNIPGTYYAEAPVVGFDPSGPNDSQGYITELATRALIFIESDNPQIGLMCFVAVGMAEVSSCEITVKKGDHIKKGDPTGSFHFGGSTHCLIFRPGVKIDFDFHGQTPCLDTINIPVKSKIGKLKNS